MKKVEIVVREVASYQSDLIIEVPAEMTEVEINTLLMGIESELECEGTFDDVSLLLEKEGYTVVSRSNSFPHSPSETEISIYGFTVEGE